MNKRRRQERQEEAKKRDLARSKRTPEQQLCLVKTRRGESKKETARLLQQIEAAKEQQKEVKK